MVGPRLRVQIFRWLHCSVQSTYKAEFLSDFFGLVWISQNLIDCTTELLMHFARQVSKYITLKKGGLEFLANACIANHRTFNQANSADGSSLAAVEGIVRH